ncbi:MAG: metallophosphoesterase, partial [Bacteroidota bacterium]
VLRVRLLDMLLGDWDRHAGNYAWSTLDSGGQKFYYVIPRDRDFALYSTGGLLPAVAKVSFEPYLVGFRKKTTNLKKLNKKAWAFDKFFLKDLTRADWENTTKHFVAQMNDGVIDAAVKAMPPEIQQLSGSSLAATLKERRNTMFENVMRYYQFISRR